MSPHLAIECEGVKIFLRQAFEVIQNEKSKGMRKLINVFDLYARCKQGAKAVKPDAPATTEAALNHDTLQGLQNLALLGKPKKLERVNLASRMEELGLHQFIGAESWPDAAPCRFD